MGLYGPHPRNTGSSTPEPIAAQPFCQGLDKFRGQAVRQAPKRVNGDLFGLWMHKSIGSGQIAEAITLGEPIV